MIVRHRNDTAHVLQSSNFLNMTGSHTENVDCEVCKPVIPYIVFYGDCRHEIQTVTSGVRMALSFQLLLRDDGKENTSSSSSANVDTVIAAQLGHHLVQ